VKWLLIFAMYSSASGPKVLEYGAFETEAECQKMGKRAVNRNRAYFANPHNEYAVQGEIWATFACVDLQNEMTRRP
jgi:hypothetical protein